MKDIQDFYEKTDIIYEEDIDKEWDEIKDKYPNTSKEEFELQQKQFQEM